MKIYGDNGIKIDLPSGGGIEDVTVGGVSVVEDNVAVIPEIPTKTSDLTNDSGFITSSSLPTKVSDLQNDLGFITQTALANYVKNTDFATTDVGGVVKASDTTKFYVNASGTPMADIIQYQNWVSTSDYAFVGKKTLDNVLTAKAYITENDIPSNVSYFTNDAGYITASDIPDPSVGDVLINGTSIVDSDGDANIPIADGDSYGVIKGLSGSGYVADDGALYASTLTAANYGTAQNYLFVSKGTLENVLASKGYALSSNVPTKVSDLNNDLGFVTTSDIPIKDITINGQSIVWSDHFGVIPVANGTDYLFEERTRGFLLQPYDIDKAVKAALCDGNGPAYTSTEQAAAQQRLGITSGGGAVDDVQVNGTSIVDENGVANIPKAKYGSEYGMSTGLITINPYGGTGLELSNNDTSWLRVSIPGSYSMSHREINDRSVITSGGLDDMVKLAMTAPIGTHGYDSSIDLCRHPAWTSEEQARARERLGITSGGGAVDDVQVNGTSIVDENGVASIPAATANTLGVVKTDPVYGTAILGTGVLALNGPTTEQIDHRTPGGKPILVGKLDYAVKAALCDGVGAAYTSEEQAAARERLGITSGGGAVDDVQINGTSIVDENGVANLKETTSHTTPGLVKIGGSNPFPCLDYHPVYKGWYVPMATATNLEGRHTNFVITPAYMDRAVRYALCDGIGQAYTSEEQAAARERLGITSGGGAVDDVTVGGVSVVNDGVAEIPAIPAKTSDLTNDSGFITSSSLPTKVSDLTNDTGFITASDIPDPDVSDVQVNGTSIVANKVVKMSADPGQGIYTSFSSTNGLYMRLRPAGTSHIDNRNYEYLPITISNFDYAVKAALCDGVGAAYTSEEQAAARERLGVSGGGSSDPTAYSPSGSANDAANIQTILDTYKSCRLAPGTYLLESEIAMYDDYCLMGSGPSTILTFSSSSGSGERALLKFCYAPSGSVADDRGGITVKDLTLRGADTISDSYITSSSSVGNDNGIRTVSDDTSIGVYRSPNKVQNVIFEKFTGYCVKQSASAYTNVDYTFGTTGRYTTNRIDFNGCTFRSSHGGYYDPGHSYTSGIAFVDCLFNFLYLGIKIGGMGVDGVNTKFTEIYGQILLCQTAEYYPYLENSFTGCYFDGTHCGETADIRINPYGDPNFRTVFTSCIFIANKGYIYNGTVSCCNCRFVNSKQTYSGYVEMELEGIDAITSFICCSSDAIFDTWGQAYSNGKCKFVGCFKDDGTEIK